MNLAWLQVGVVYAIAVALTRRARVDLPRSIALLFYALVLVFFFKPLTGPYSNATVDYVKRLPPWSYVTDGVARNTDTNDHALQLVPWAHQARESWKKLEPPIWNASSGSGHPLLGAGQASALSPVRLLALPLPLAFAMSAEGAFEVLIALTFTFLLCRQRKHSVLASLFAAVAYGFGGYVVIWLHFPHALAACFLPGVLYMVELLAEKVTPARVGIAAVVWASIVFGGHPETAAHIFFIAMLWAVWMVAVERTASWKFFLVLGGVMAIAGMLAAPFLLPFVETLVRSLRYWQLKGKPWDVEELPYTDFASMIVQLQPRFFGATAAGSKWGPSDPDTMAGFAGILGTVAWLATAISVVRRRAWRSRETFYVLTTVFVFGAMMGWPVLSRVLHIVMPLIAHQRLRLLLAILLSLLAAALIDRVREGERLPLAIATVAVAIVLLRVLTYGFIPSTQVANTRNAAIPSMIVLACAFVVAVLPRLRDIPVAVLLVCVTGELFANTYAWNPAVPVQDFYPKTPLIEALEKLRDRIPKNEPFRITGWQAMLYVNTPPIYGFEDMRVYDPMGNVAYMKLLRDVGGYDIENLCPFWRDLESPLNDYLNVRYALVDPGYALDPAHYRIVYEGKDGRIGENLRVLPRFFAVRNVLLEFNDERFAKMLATHREWAQTAIIETLKLETEQQRDDFFKPRPENAPLATTKIVEASTTRYRLRVDAPRYSLVASSIPYWPGWKVERNGKRIEPIRVNGVFLGFAVPPGTSDVRVWYAPASFRIGVALALTALVALVAMVVRERRVSR